MATSTFERDRLAEYYGKRHLKTDPGIVEIYHLPGNAPEREIRLLEVNALLATRQQDPLEPLDFGVDAGSESEHKLLVLDVTRDQWEQIRQAHLALPTDWTLDGAIPIEPSLDP